MSINKSRRNKKWKKSSRQRKRERSTTVAQRLARSRREKRQREHRAEYRKTLEGRCGSKNEDRDAGFVFGPPLIEVVSVGEKK